MSKISDSISKLALIIEVTAEPCDSIEEAPEHLRKVRRPDTINQFVFNSDDDAISLAPAQGSFVVFAGIGKYKWNSVIWHRIIEVALIEDGKIKEVGKVLASKAPWWRETNGTIEIKEV